MLAKILETNSWGQWIVVVFLIRPIASTIAPLLFSAQADQRYSADRIVLMIAAASTVLNIIAFRMLQIGDNPLAFLFWFLLLSMITAPAMALLNTITFVHLDGNSNKFGLFRVWGTLGWIAAGVLVSLLKLDQSAAVGYVSAAYNVVAVFFCYFLPSTRPIANGNLRLRDRLGLSSLRLLPTRDVGVVILGSCALMMPLTAVFMHIPLFISELGVQRIAATMSIGQLTEVVALFGLSGIMRRLSYRALFTAGLLLAFVRYALFAVADPNSTWLLVVAISLHGLCWSFYFEVSRVFLHERAPPEFRAQVQALAALATSGIGSIAGAILVGIVFHRLAPQQTGWSTYWWALAAWCAACAVGFLLLFRDGHSTPKQPWKKPTEALVER